MSRRSFWQRRIDGFFTNLDQDDMGTAEKLTKLARNRFKATVLMQGCCGHHGEPGC